VITYVDNAEGDFAQLGWMAPESLFQRNVRFAVDTWAAHFVSPHEISVKVEASRAVSRAGGTPTTGAMIGRQGTLAVWEPGPLTRMRTGLNPGAPAVDADLKISLNVPYLGTNYWLDPDPGTGQPVPPGRTDVVSIVLHELGHALGIAGYRSQRPESYGQFSGGSMTAFDALTSFVGGQPVVEGAPNRLVFTGSAAMALFGGAVPLASFGYMDFLYSQNHYHLGHFSISDTGPDSWRSHCLSTTSDPLARALMTTCPVPVDGRRLQITAMDLAILADLGYPLAPDP
jgi:hypothetical protein